MQSLKQSVARRLALRAADPFWQARYYDFNVWSEMKFVEKLLSPGFPLAQISTVFRDTVLAATETNLLF